MLANYNGHLETARMILERGAEVDRLDDRAQPSVGGVAFKGYEEVVGLRLEHGADIGADNGRRHDAHHVRGALAAEQSRRAIEGAWRVPPTLQPL